MKVASPARAYRALYGRYGPQGWWPVTPRAATRPVYRPGRRLRLTEREAFEVAVGAILTQNTAWGNVARALEALHQEGPLTVARLLRLPRRRLERLIRPSGYFRQKAQKLRDFASAVAARGGHLSRWLRGSGPRARQELLAVRGIGPETADSILLFAAHQDAFVIDAYTLRIGSRVGWFPAGKEDGSEKTYDEAQRLLVRGVASLGSNDAGRVAVYQEFHALLVRLAKLHCRTQPLCGACPLKGGCRHAA